MWAPLGTGLLDILLIVAAAILALAALSGDRRFKLWEALAALGLAAATVHVARTGIWLLFLLAYPAARGLALREPGRRVLIVAGIALAVALVSALVAGPGDPGSRPLAALAAQSEEPVLADAVLGQQVVLAGGTVWVENPIDAFRRGDQRLYLDWLAGKPSGAGAVSHVGLVLVEASSPAGKRAVHDPRLERVDMHGTAILYRVRGGITGR